MGEKTKKKFKLCVTNHMFYKIVLDDHNNYKNLAVVLIQSEF